jgi:hypothetical protein
MTTPTTDHTPTHPGDHMPIRIEKGRATPEELAAVAVLLLSRPSADSASRPARDTTDWRDHHFDPCSWQSM